MDVPVRVVVLPHGVGLPLPRWATAGAAGADVHAALDTPVEIAPGGRAVIPTGLRMAIPEGWEIQVRPRSGLARRGVTVMNAPGTIDCDYRGEVLVTLVNHGEEAHRVERGDRIAQLVLAPVHRAVWEVVASLDETARGEGGFGSTGR